MSWAFKERADFCRRWSRPARRTGVTWLNGQVQSGALGTRGAEQFGWSRIFAHMNSGRESDEHLEG